MKKFISLVLLLTAFQTVAVHAQEPLTADSACCSFGQILQQHRKVITNTQIIGFGAASILDTYLSPEEYSGGQIRYMSHTLRETEGKKWLRRILHQGVAAYAHNRADNANMMAGAYRFSYGILRSWSLVGGSLQLRLGGMADANVGFLYNTRNGNNPAQAKLSIDIGPVAMAAYNTNMSRMPLYVEYEICAPLCGVMFSPNYGQSYYEIFSKGNYDHNAVPTTFLSTPSMSQMLTVGLGVGKTVVKVGYLGDYRQEKVNNLKYHCYSHMFVVGITRRFSIVKL